MMEYRANGEEEARMDAPLAFEEPEYTAYKIHFFDELRSLDDDHILLGYVLGFNDKRSERAVLKGIDIREQPFDRDLDYYANPELIPEDQILVILALGIES